MPWRKPSYWLQSPFLRQSITLFSGSLLAQLFPLLITPILTRCYTKEDFGTLALISTMASLWAAISAGRYEVAIMLPGSNAGAHSLVRLSNRLIWISTAILMVLVLAWARDFSDWLEQPGLTVYLYLLPLMSLTAASAQVLNYWQLRMRKFTAVSLARVLQGGCNALLSLVLGLGRFAFNGLIIGYFIGMFAQLLALFFTSRKSLQQEKTQSNLPWQKQKQLLHQYRDFPRINAPQTLIDLLQMAGVISLLTYYFGPAVAGMYGFCIRILQAPLNLIGSALGQVFFKEASERYSQGQSISALVQKTIKSLAAISILPFLTLIFFSGPLFSFVFGKEWYEAGRMAAALSPWLMMQFILSPISQLPAVVGKQGPVFLMSLLGNFLIVGWIVAGGVWIDDLILALRGLSISMFAFYLLVLVYFVQIARRQNTTQP